MQTKMKHQLHTLSLAAAILALTSVACNNNDYKTSDDSTSDSTQLNAAAPATPAGQPATANQPASTDKDTIDNMGRVRPSTTAVKPEANKEGVAKSGTATPPARATAVHHRKRASATIVMTDKMAGAIAPEFPGGQQALDNFVNEHIKYPQDAIDNDVTGVVRVAFTVDENGRISKARLINPQKIGEGLDEEALRVVNSMPEWKPGTLHGKKVKTRLELPISFQVES
jgi:TonB family protein